MNSLNIISARVIGLSSPTSNSQKDFLSDRKSISGSRKQSRGKAGSSQSEADGTQPVTTSACKDNESHAYRSSEKTQEEHDGKPGTLLLNPDKTTNSHPPGKLQVLTRGIVDAIATFLTTIGAPLSYVIRLIKTSRPSLDLRSFYGSSKRASSTATAVGLSNTKQDGRPLQRDVQKPSSPKLRATGSNESLASTNTSDSDIERTKSKSRPRSLEVRHPKTTKQDDDTGSKRSIRIQESRLRPSERRKKKSGLLPTANETLTLDSLKSPMAASQYLKIHKYPNEPSPPRPLIPRNSHLQKTLIIDLDETLIHSLAKGGRLSSGYMVEVKLNATVDLGSGSNSPVIGPQHPILYYVHKRPHCDEFLRKVCQWYKLVLFTASVQEYADPVIDLLEQERRFFDARRYRQHCTFLNGAYIKDLSSVEPDLSRVVILDNSPMSYNFHEGRRKALHRVMASDCLRRSPTTIIFGADKFLKFRQRHPHRGMDQ